MLPPLRERERENFDRSIASDIARRADRQAVVYSSRTSSRSCRMRERSLWRRVGLAKGLEPRVPLQSSTEYLGCKGCVCVYEVRYYEARHGCEYCQRWE